MRSAFVLGVRGVTYARKVRIAFVSCRAGGAFPFLSHRPLLSPQERKALTSSSSHPVTWIGASGSRFKKEKKRKSVLVD